MAMVTEGSLHEHVDPNQSYTIMQLQDVSQTASKTTSRLRFSQGKQQIPPLNLKVSLLYSGCYPYFVAITQRLKFKLYLIRTCTFSLSSDAAMTFKLKQGEQHWCQSEKLKKVTTVHNLRQPTESHRKKHQVCIESNATFCILCRTVSLYAKAKYSFHFIKELAFAVSARISLPLAYL